jgi:hypothetical protein
MACYHYLSRGCEVSCPEVEVAVSLTERIEKDEHAQNKEDVACLIEDS